MLRSCFQTLCCRLHLDAIGHLQDLNPVAHVGSIIVSSFVRRKLVALLTGKLPPGSRSGPAAVNMASPDTREACSSSTHQAAELSEGEPTERCQKSPAGLTEAGSHGRRRITPFLWSSHRRKTDGSWRVLCDTWSLKATTEPLVKPLPHVDALMDEMRGAQWFTNLKVYLAQGYHHSREANSWKTSFCSQRGQIELKVMPLGLQELSLSCH